MLCEAENALAQQSEALWQAIDRGHHLLPSDRLGAVAAPLDPWFQRAFRLDPRERFASQLGWLCSEGFATVNGDDIILSRDGLMQVDRLLHEFFLPSHRPARYS